MACNDSSNELVQTYLRVVQTPRSHTCPLVEPQSGVVLQEPPDIDKEDE